LVVVLTVAVVLGRGGIDDRFVSHPFPEEPRKKELPEERGFEPQFFVSFPLEFFRAGLDRILYREEDVKDECRLDNDARIPIEKSARRANDLNHRPHQRFLAKGWVVEGVFEEEHGFDLLIAVAVVVLGFALAMLLGESRSSFARGKGTGALAKPGKSQRETSNPDRSDPFVAATRRRENKKSKGNDLVERQRCGRHRHGSESI